ncbi:MAG: winged helix-turn-helix transcriptional regulator [Myxococcales bacterium]|nr:winged helix-turn-helix transcriptional regulator [Myxococcales bacterium]
MTSAQVDVDETLSALADPTRRHVIDLLRRRPRRSGELAEATGTTAPTMSRHLKVLRDRGLVREEHDGEDARVRVYRLAPEPFAALRKWIEDVERFWSLELEGFREHVERTRGGTGPRGGGRR